MVPKTPAAKPAAKPAVKPAASKPVPTNNVRVMAGKKPSDRITEEYERKKQELAAVEEGNDDDLYNAD
ncbi:MAG: hypothetical protein Q9172_005121 [Xanthocarpia lactea]